MWALLPYVCVQSKVTCGDDDNDNFIFHITMVKEPIRAWNVCISAKDKCLNSMDNFNKLLLNALLKRRLQIKNCKAI